MKEIRFHNAAVAAQCARRGDAYCSLVASLGRRDGPFIVLTEDALKVVRKAFPKQKAVVKVSLTTQLFHALKKWARSGFKVPSLPAIHSRHIACRSCHLNVGFGIFGACKKCKCTGAKLLLATETCPLNLW